MSLRFRRECWKDGIIISQGRREACLEEVEVPLGLDLSSRCCKETSESKTLGETQMLDLFVCG